MDDKTVEARKAELDNELTKTGQHVGIALGLELFGAFKDRGWLTLGKFGVLGTELAATKLPAYGSHYVFATWDLADDQFRVGKDS
jgi:hypothetical protein